VSRILHLSDLHLGNTVEEDKVGDYKIEAINESDRVTRVGHMKTTLKALGRRLDSRGEKLDALVVTGDVTTQGRVDGFDRLPEVLKELGEALPAPDRIVIVPGNHDVAWFTAPGSPERYENFVKKVRPLGYVTPLLDGVDYNAGGTPKNNRRPFIEGDDFVIIAVNSADMCGVLEPFSSSAETNLEALTRAGAINTELAREIHQVRTYDMPRLTPRQIAALGDVIHGLRKPSKVLFVAMHHHLLPVTAEEEAKAFESFANLGTVLGFLGAAHVDVVLHGHKHVEGTMPLALRNDDQGVYEAVVASCGTIGGMQGVNHEIAKLIDVDSSLPTLRSVTVSSVRVPSGSTLKLPDKCVVSKSTTHVRRTTVAAARTVSGQTVSDVHEQLI
jgi:3',5'-cyclic AMP phosphodiesterase CpdA